MTEAEFLEIINLHAANAMTGFSLYISFTFAFLVAVYYVGTQLSGLQTLLLTFLYVISVASSAMSCVTHCHSFESVMAKYPTFVPSPLWDIGWSICMAVVMCAGVFAGVYFMFHTRHKAT